MIASYLRAVCCDLSLEKTVNPLNQLTRYFTGLKFTYFWQDMAVLLHVEYSHVVHMETDCYARHGSITVYQVQSYSAQQYMETSCAVLLYIKYSHIVHNSTWRQAV